VASVVFSWVVHDCTQGHFIRCKILLCCLFILLMIIYDTSDYTNFFQHFHVVLAVCCFWIQQQNFHWLRRDGRCIKGKILRSFGTLTLACIQQLHDTLDLPLFFPNRIFRGEEHLYKRLRWSVGPSVCPSPTMRDYVEK
jgi:hypothetical protein